MDASYPPFFENVVAEHIQEGLWMQKAIEGGEVPNGYIAEPEFWKFGWRWGFSKRARLADAADSNDACVAALEGVDALEWGAREKLFAELRDDASSRGEDWGLSDLLGYESSERAVRQSRARLRIIRAAARWRATGKVPDLPDPFGGRLLYEATGDGVRIWSRGEDGEDNGGAPRNGLDPWDIVIELKRPPASQDGADR